MITDKTWKFVTNALTIMQQQSDRLDVATDKLLIRPESPLIEPVGIIESQLISALSLLVDDDWENISWYVYENDYGRGGMEAGYDGMMKTIDTHEKLRWLIEA